MRIKVLGKVDRVYSINLGARFNSLNLYLAVKMLQVL